MAKKQARKTERVKGVAARQKSSGRASRVVGIGASAGGLEAFTEILRALPADTGMGFVFIQHLDPKHVSTLTEILARETSMPIAEARNGMRIQAGHAYVIPRNTSMTVRGGILRVGARSAAPGPATSIDVFFRSLAKDLGDQAIGVVLSGSAGDGTSGLKAIKEAGGVTFAQTPQSAKYDSMPRSAIASGCVDLIRSPGEIALELVRIGQHINDGSKAKTVEPADGIASVAALLRAATGVDFSNYKTNTIQRRIARRLTLRRMAGINEYLNLLRADPAELQALYEDILINVTEFFRDPEVFAALKSQVFSKLIPPKGRDKQIRIWAPACSTGEEVYSLAITLLEYLEARAENIGIQIFATDISEQALEKARAGVYPASIAHSVSAERLRNFFVNVESGYQISKRVRELCVFAKHNMAKDPPFSRMDLISCRNVLIYMDEKLQNRVLPTLHYALKPDGFLVLGASETVGRHSDHFVLIDKKQKIYTRKHAPLARIPTDYTFQKQSSDRLEPLRKPDHWNEGEVQRETDRILLQRFSPPGVVLDEQLNILQFRGETSAFIEPMAGRATLNLMKMVKEWLSHELKQAIARARKSNVAVRRKVAADGGALTIEVIPFRRRTPSELRFLVLFEQEPAEKKIAARHGGRKSSLEVLALEREATQLKQELAATKEHLQSVLEDQDAANEELHSASEEIQSSNEELQSTNEELETAKEELQSTNEELNTLNEELQTRNLQLSQTGNDLLNLLANVQMPIVILGNDLRIRRFTPIAEKVLNLIPADVGRPISDINLGIKLPDLKRALLDVTENLVSKILDVKDAEGRTYSLRMRPYRTEDNKIDGVVMVLVDVDPESRWAEDGMQGALDRLSAMNRQQTAGLEGMRSALAAGRDDLRSLASTLLQAQEEERRRLSHELHDELNQKLALLELNIQNLQHRAGPIPDAVREELEGFRRTVSELSDDLRRIAYRLHPSILEDLGLIVALESYCEEFTEREGIQVRFKHKDVPAVALRSVALCLYRVAQESLRNVAKHSGAKRATVTLNGSEGAVELTVRDAGAGFVLNQARLRGALGMLGMEERVRLVRGSIAWSTRPGGGTCVKVRVPLAASLPLEPEPEDQARASAN